MALMPGAMLACTVVGGALVAGLPDIAAVANDKGSGQRREDPR
jgi:hypothetical protein